MATDYETRVMAALDAEFGRVLSLREYVAALESIAEDVALRLSAARADLRHVQHAQQEEETMSDPTSKYVSVPNLMAESASAFGPACVGCRSTRTDVMVSFGKLVPYDGANKPRGEIDPKRVVDVFLPRAAAERLREELTRALAD